ncbi:hypothetical protein OCK74_27265 [Chitinophagaceae bacterium LB-8]|uniref:Uncharacterized protein n=1 Tax=Paraflavisolibacter caeni TaxID=2982496 RepID=A0A9X3BHT2_9BACT|nr:hypothetical protein [Paraflavisolibacter caeni]MCU7552849.1 hypothetical protein [Paraflavisolibacter caeni]
MWTSTNFDTYPKQFDFTSSERGKPTFTALKIEGKDFINMVEQLDGEIGDEQIFQTIICDHCGIHHCASGNWVALRQQNGYVFFIPAFEAIADEPNSGEYDPPYSLQQKGALWLPLSEFDNFKKIVPELAKLKSINTLTKSELIWLYKWDTPHKMFGDFPNFQPVRKNHVLVASELDNETIFNIIEQKLAELENINEFTIQALAVGDSIISLYLDDINTTEWKALYKTDNQYGLLLGGTFKIETKS